MSWPEAAEQLGECAVLISLIVSIAAIVIAWIRPDRR
jgi:hypothetical protein